MARKNIFICDKCGKEYDEAVLSKTNEWPLNIVVRLTSGYTENNQYGGYAISRTWCADCCKQHGVKIDTKAGGEARVQAPVETVEDKIIYFLEELGFRRE